MIMVAKDLLALPEDLENLVHQGLKEEMEFQVLPVQKECKVKREIQGFKDCLEFREKMELM